MGGFLKIVYIAVAILLAITIFQDLQVGYSLWQTAFHIALPLGVGLLCLERANII